MPDPQNIEIETSPSPPPEAAPDPAPINPPNPASSAGRPLNQGGEIPNPAPVETPAETLPTEAPAVINPPNPLYQGGIAPVFSPTPSPEPAVSPIKILLLRAKEKIQFRKRAKSEKIMDLIKSKATANATANAGQAGQAERAGQGKITNNEVQKLLRCSDATATRYLRELVKQGRLKMVGGRGGAFYEWP